MPANPLISFFCRIRSKMDDDQRRAKEPSTPNLGPWMADEPSGAPRYTLGRLSRMVCKDVRKDRFGSSGVDAEFTDWRGVKDCRAWVVWGRVSLLIIASHLARRDKG